MIKSKCRYDISEDCRHYNDCLPCMLDKIRAEVTNLTDGQIPERIWNIDVLQIIDRYKAESEE